MRLDYSVHRVWCVEPDLFSGQNVANLLRQIAPILLIGIGQSYVLITGNIDLSIGSVVGMSCMISATLMTKGINPGCCWNHLRLLHPGGCSQWSAGCQMQAAALHRNLGTMTIARGIAQIVNNNYNTDSIGDGAQAFRDFFYYGKFLGVYNTIWIAVVL